MGISGLLPFVKNACRAGNIIELKGKSVAVDVSCLLHRGLTGCMDKIHMGEDTTSYVYYVEKYIKELLSYDCHIVMVFDGRPLPSKKQTNDDRRERREKNIEHAELLLAKGQEKQARDKFRLATKISSNVVETTIAHFRNWKNVDIVVAPYEADAQLAYLMKAELVDAVITEDSDLIVFGCETIYFKWQSGSGECTVYEKKNLPKCFTGELGGDKFDFVKFRRICIISGCDYLQSGVPGVGLTTAVKFFGKTSITHIPTLLKKLPSYLNNGKLKNYITPEFIANFIKAENTFEYQVRQSNFVRRRRENQTIFFRVVFDPRERCQKPLNPYPELDNDIIELGGADSQESNKFHYAGDVLNANISTRLALGNSANGSCLDDKFLPNDSNPSWSVWSDKFQSKGKIQEMEKKEREKPQIWDGGAFKLDPPSLKRVKKSNDSESSKKRMKFCLDDEDDIVQNFMDDVKNAAKKRKNAPDIDYSAEEMLAKFAKKPKIDEPEVDDAIFGIRSQFGLPFIFHISEFTTQPSSSQPEMTKIDYSIEKEEPALKPSPIALRKTKSSPTSSNIKKFQSPILTTRNSESIVPSKPKIVSQSRFFAKNTGSPSVSNPFRRPAFIKTEEIAKKDSEEKTPKIDSPLSVIETENTVTINTFRFVGFKGAGLSRKKF
ncbi:unnamed protein product [Caenorhabditis bovis]|uniref:Exonuclease 1 n=1 Tax=Caenorhabditis bovis TaxID=2654633 RepID=A0A8S1EMF3_9PELO|nr:unnamed protein product [Caenorhabditis bovis]